ncbi:MAG TPA: phosphohistidine phosphatase SixA [Thermodesulfovibrionales bacterium]|jgi:phosphohistidine phosphatase|nr:phosphohistidine phosphatase SixA [Thermodesulfovibrionales bacterium]
MLLYLVRHGEAEEEKGDPARPLSEQGISATKATASHLSRMKIRVNQILHSKKLRAKQTAEIIAEHLTAASYKEFTETDGLSPLDDPGTWDDRLKYLTDDLMLVGHMPHLGKLASLLLCGDGEKDIVAFRPSSVLCLERDERSHWRLQWMITPDMIM